jgi:glycosyltransferase involved in cell wall biosynthesis
MKVLLSAYACEPNRGSEPGVGWSWAMEIAKRGNKVLVITRLNNKQSIESVILNNLNIEFIYYDLPAKLMWLKKVFGVHVYYLLWQIGIFFNVKKNLYLLQPDIIHHITFVAIRKYSFLGFLGIPFYYGPLGGGESCPAALLQGLPPSYRLKELFRNNLNSFVKWNPIARVIFNRSRLIFTTTNESAAYLPYSLKNKIHSFPAIGIDKVNKQINKVNQNENLKILYVGHFIYLKGLQIVLDSLILLRSENVDFTLTLVGKGEFEPFLKNKVEFLGLSENIRWINWLPQERLKELYLEHDVFLFPSLHDSGGMVVLEAMINGLPVLSFNLGGPGYFNNNNIGWVLDVNNKTYQNVVDEMAGKLNFISKHPNETLLKSKRCQEYSNNYSWEQTVGQVYNIIENDFKNIIKE